MVALAESIFSLFDNIVVLDTETTGIDSKKDEIIELAAVQVSQEKELDSFDVLIKLSEGRRLPPEITKLTGISEEDILREGVEKREACERLCKMLSEENTLVVAYNAQFDLCFIYYLLKAFDMAGSLRGIKMLDALTVYKDRREYPHKLCNAIEAYGVKGENSHRALDDTLATVELLRAMEAECCDLSEYINLFGYNPKFGVSGTRISSVRYEPQPYFRTKKLYE